MKDRTTTLLALVRDEDIFDGIVVSERNVTRPASWDSVAGYPTYLHPTFPWIVDLETLFLPTTAASSKPLYLRQIE